MGHKRHPPRAHKEPAPHRDGRRLSRDLLVLKTIIMIGLVATYFLPQDHAIVVGVTSNLLWLWRT